MLNVGLFIPCYVDQLYPQVGIATLRILRRLGLEAEHVSWLAQRGYTPGTIQNMLADLAQVGRWLAAEGLEAAGQTRRQAHIAFDAAPARLLGDGAGTRLCTCW